MVFLQCFYNMWYFLKYIYWYIWYICGSFSDIYGILLSDMQVYSIDTWVSPVWDARLRCQQESLMRSQWWLWSGGELLAGVTHRGELQRGWRVLSDSDLAYKNNYYFTIGHYAGEMTETQQDGGR